MSATTASTPGIGTLTLPPRVPVIMVNFKNYAFSTTKAHADSLFNSTTDLKTNMGTRIPYYYQQVVSHGSVAMYFADQSLGQYRPLFDVVGPVTLSQNYGYYGQNVGNNSSSRAGEMVIEACQLVNDSVDFSQYDSDKDGYIDLVFILFAGLGENDKGLIDTAFHVVENDLVWPHYSTVGGSNRFDDKILRAYECSNEIDGYLSQPSCLVPAGSGILVHEYSHGMGLPDVYYNNTKYMGFWELMDYGCYNMETFVPATYVGYERWFCQWNRPIWLNEAKDVTLRPIATSGDFAVITASGDTLSHANANTTYWIIENHQATPGSWDYYAQGKGLIVYQIHHHNNWRDANSVTGGYVLFPADGTLRVDGHVGKQGDCYPYPGKDTLLIPDAPDFPITAITQLTNGDISFKVCGGTPQPAAFKGESMNREISEPEKIIYHGVIYIRRGNKLYTLTGNETNIL